LRACWPKLPRRLPLPPDLCPNRPDELKAVQAIGNAPTPDDAIKAAEDLLTNYADTEYKEYALTMEAAPISKSATG
jgi:hypothetical protein